jgi:hypothetical protein
MEGCFLLLSEENKAREESNGLLSDEGKNEDCDKEKLLFECPIDQ